MQDKTNEKLKSAELNKAVNILKKGGVIIFPTDTVFGIGCQYNNQIALKRVRKIKGSNQNFPILVASIEEAEKIVDLNEQAKVLVQKYWPGGLTLVCKTKDGDKIGVRMPDSSRTLELIEKLGAPIIGTSANFHGDSAPKTFEDLNSILTKKVDFVLSGKCQRKKESTVIDTTVRPNIILRQGAVKL